MKLISNGPTTESRIRGPHVSGVSISLVLANKIRYILFRKAALAAGIAVVAVISKAGSLPLENTSQEDPETGEFFQKLNIRLIGCIGVACLLPGVSAGHECLKQAFSN